MNVLTIQGLSKAFGGQKIIDDLNMAVPEGSVFGFIGQNGAGKTTTMKMVLGLLRPDQGEINVCGEPVHFGQTKSNQYIGYLPDVPEFYDYMTPARYLALCGEIIGLSKTETQQRGEGLLSLVGLGNVKKTIGGFSRGMKQRLGIAQALLTRPKLLICDEPTSALDPVGRKEILDILRKISSTTSDIDIMLAENGELIDPGLLQQLGEMPGVKNAFGRRYAQAVPAEFSVAVDRDNVDILSYDTLQLDWIPGDGDLRKGGDLGKVYGDQGYVLCIWDKDVPLTVGDRITLCGSTVEIAGMMTSNPFSNNGRTDGDVILICSDETFIRLTGEEGYSIASVQMLPDAADEEAEAIHDTVRGRYEFVDRREEADSSTLFAFSLFLYGFLVIIALITMLNIINSISMSVSARTKQYGAMRAVGMDSGQLTGMIAAEAATYALAGCILGCGAGLPLSKLLYDKLVTSHFPYFTWTLPVSSLLIILLFVLLATLTAVYAPAKRMREMAVTENINEL